MNVRCGFSVVEIVVALSVLAVAGIFVAQTATWAVQERAALDERDRAITIAENLLETAKSQKPGELKSWAQSVKLPAEILARWPKSTLKIEVVEDHGMKKVTVSVALMREASTTTKPATLTAWIASAKAGAL